MQKLGSCHFSIVSTKWMHTCWTCNSKTVRIATKAGLGLPPVVTRAGISFGSTTFNEACVFSGRAPESAACSFVVTRVDVGTLE